MPEGEFKYFGDWLRTRRMERNITIQELSKQSNVSQTTISVIEMGLRLPSRLTLDAIVRGLIAICGIQSGAEIARQYLSWQAGRKVDLSPAEKMIQDAYHQGDEDMGIW